MPYEYEFVDRREGDTDKHPARRRADPKPRPSRGTAVLWLVGLGLVGFACLALLVVR
jgi:hypothetical protein